MQGRSLRRDAGAGNPGFGKLVELLRKSSARGGHGGRIHFGFAEVILLNTMVCGMKPAV
jgi:hypothetical protein